MFDSLLDKARAGDKASKEEIINRLQPLIISSIRRYYNKPKEYERSNPRWKFKYIGVYRRL